MCLKNLPHSLGLWAHRRHRSWASDKKRPAARDCYLNETQLQRARSWGRREALMECASPAPRSERVCSQATPCSAGCPSLSLKRSDGKACPWHSPALLGTRGSRTERRPPGPSKEAASVQASPLNLTPALGNSTVEPQLWSCMPGNSGPVGP